MFVLPVKVHSAEVEAKLILHVNDVEESDVVGIKEDDIRLALNGIPGVDQVEVLKVKFENLEDGAKKAKKK